MRMVYGWTWWFFEVDSAAAFAAAFDVAALPVGTIVMYRCNDEDARAYREEEDVCVVSCC